MGQQLEFCLRPCGIEELTVLSHMGVQGKVGKKEMGVEGTGTNKVSWKLTPLYINHTQQ